jgi:segregation and condensation protein B
MGNKHPLLDRLPGLRATCLPRNRPMPLIYRLLERESSDEAGQDALGRDARLATVEAALMAADEPLTARRLMTVAGLADAAEARRLVARLQSLYEQDGSAFQVEELAGGWQLLTKAEYHPWLSRLRKASAEARLTPAMREALTIVAYRQPVTRADLDAVRGVQSGDVLRQLMERGLVRITGRDDSLGRPQLYGTTKKFLQAFGLKTIRELPPTEGVAAAPKATKDEAEEERGAGL